ncbi:PASTA domain-containing protein [bacterium]
MEETTTKSKQQIILGIIALFGALIILFIMADKIILPIYTKQGVDVQLPDIYGKSALEADSILSAQGFRLIIDDSEYHPIFPESTVVFQKPACYTNVKRGRRIYVHISAGERTVIVPSIIGVSERDAELKLKQAGLEVGEIKYRISNYPKNVVCSQDLPQNTEVTEKTEVTFTVSLGRSKSQYITPNVIGIQFSEAVSMIKKEGLQIGKIQYQIEDKLIPETVIDQEPKGGVEVQPGASVQIIISQLEDE